MPSDAAPLVELFASYQGEGPYAGAPHAFVRLGGCNLRCAYCDTPEGIVPPPTYRLETEPFGGTFETRPNPCSVEDCAGHLERMTRGPVRFHAVAVTGGEPLLHAGFLARLLPRLRPLFPRTYLDTNATLPRELATIADLLDIVSLSVKLPSCPGVRAAWKEAEACLRIAGGLPAAGGRGRPAKPARRAPRRGRDVFVKVVLTRESTEAEVARAAAMVAAVRPATTLILQPATRVPGGPEPPGGDRVRRLLAAATAHLTDVRVLPQVHPVFGWK
jgi:organic radical activating enzyme